MCLEASIIKQKCQNSFQTAFTWVRCIMYMPLVSHRLTICRLVFEAFGHREILSQIAKCNNNLMIEIPLCPCVCILHNTWMNAVALCYMPRKPHAHSHTHNEHMRYKWKQSTRMIDDFTYSIMLYLLRSESRGEIIDWNPRLKLIFIAISVRI